MPNRIIRDWTDSERIDGLSFQAEVLLLRLMMKADDLGAYHANPKLINSFCFPLKNIRETDITRWLQELVSAGLIALYEAENKRLLHIINFGQRMRTVKPKFPQITEVELNKIMSATCQQSAVICPPEEEVEYEVEDEEEGNSPSLFKEQNITPLPEERKKVAPKKEKEVVDFFNETCTRLSKVQIISVARKKKIAARISEVGFDKILEIITEVSQSDFLNGNNPRNWTADFDWILEPRNFTKILEGNYRNKNNGYTPKAAGSLQRAKRR